MSQSAQSAPSSCTLPLPNGNDQRLILRCLRRMAAHGTHDAQAALWAIEAFGQHFRRPLVLLRAYVVEVAQASTRQIQVAHCCAMRMTQDEARLVGVLVAAGHKPALAAQDLRHLMGGTEIASPFSLAVAFNQDLAELGRPLGL